MSIYGLTDRPVIRRDGKIRGGFKETRNGKEVPVNTEHFLLHDASQLIPILGEKPKEIYFTIYFDDINAVAPNDLRWYTKTDLQCVGNAQQAAYMGVNDVAGMRQEQGFLIEKNPDGSPRKVVYPRSRSRVCAWKACPEYIAGSCSEHIRLDMVIPQYGMGSLFTFENTSFNGLMNIVGALDKARLANMHRGGKISGEIFRLYKEEMSLPYENAKTGQRGRSDRHVVFMEHVKFEEYTAKFKGKCPTESWEALVALRTTSLMLPSQVMQITAPSEVAALPQTVEAPAILTQQASNEDILKTRANAPEAAKLFEEIAALKGVSNTEEKRIATAKVCQDVQSMVNKLKAAIAKEKKSKEGVVTHTEQATVNHMIPPSMPTQPAVQQTGSLF